MKPSVAVCICSCRQSTSAYNFFLSYPVGGRWGSLKTKLEILSNLSLSLLIFFSVSFLFHSPPPCPSSFRLWFPSLKREGSSNDRLAPIDWLVTLPLKCAHTAVLPVSLWSLLIQEASSSLEKLYFLCKRGRNCFWRVRLTEALGSFWNHSCSIQANLIYTWWCFELSKQLINGWALGKIHCTRYPWKMARRL